MARFFFNLHGSSNIFDTEGSDLPDIHAVHAMMISMASKFMSETGAKKDWEMEVLDEEGKIVSTMDFGIDPQ